MNQVQKVTFDIDDSPCDLFCHFKSEFTIWLDLLDLIKAFSQSADVFFFTKSMTITQVHRCVSLSFTRNTSYTVYQQ